MATSDLLSPFGEGYCGRCAFVVGLDPTGMLSHHSRGRYDQFDGPGTRCPGGGRPAWKRTPYYSAKARFSATGGKALCTACKRGVPVTVSTTHGVRLKWHTTLDGFKDCPGSNQLVKNTEGLPLNAVR